MAETKNQDNAQNFKISSYCFELTSLNS